MDSNPIILGKSSEKNSILQWAYISWRAPCRASFYSHPIAILSSLYSFNSKR